MSFPTKTLFAAALAATLSLMLSTAHAQASLTGSSVDTPVASGETSPIEVSEAEFDRVASWLGETEDAETLPEFLIHNGGAPVLQEWVKSAQVKSGIDPLEVFVERMAPAVKTELAEQFASGAMSESDGASLLIYLIETQQGVFDDWVSQAVLGGAQAPDQFLRERAADWVAKWEDSRVVPARTVSLDEWQGGGTTDQILGRGNFISCRCNMLVTFAHNTMLPNTVEAWDYNSKKKQLWKRQREHMASHSAEIYAMGKGEKIEVPDTMYQKVNRTGIRVLTLCRDRFLRQCQGCVAKGKVYGAYSSSVRASAHLFGDFHLGRSESGASDLAKLQSGHGDFRITQFEKGVATEVASERKFDTDALIQFGKTLAGLNFSKKQTSQEKAESGIKLVDATIKFLKDVIVEVGPATTNIRMQDMRAEYDGSISDSDFLEIWPNQTWSLELVSDGRVTYGGRGKHRIWGEPNGTYFTSGSALGVAITDYVCPADVPVPRRIAAWSHSHDPLLAQLKPEEYPARLSEFFRHVLNVAPPDTSTNQGAVFY